MGQWSFLPQGLVATAAQAAARPQRRAIRRGARSAKRQFPGRTARKNIRREKRSRLRATRRPRPGTKAWMAYIRGMRKRKRGKRSAR